VFAGAAMRVERLQLENHPLFGNFDIDFTGVWGPALDTIVIAGINGTGKTTLLTALMEAIDYRRKQADLSSVRVDLTRLYKQKLKRSIVELQTGVLKHDLEIHDIKTVNQLKSELREIPESERPKLIYMPTEINFSGLKTTTLSFSRKYDFVNIVDQKVINDIPSYLATEVNNEVFKFSHLPAKEAIDRVCHEINSLFDILEIDARMTGLKPEGEKLPVFKNSAGKEFDINYLSSGEKQLFVRAMALRMLKANNSVILIDEPEISMHPGWQQKIVNVYRKIGRNNQIIFATHSPHVVASVPKESVRLLKREAGRINLVDYRELNGSYGLPVDIVLKELMELKTVRAPEVEKEIRDLWDMLHQGLPDAGEFNRRYQELENLLGGEDEDLLLMRIEIAKLETRKDGKNAAHQKGQTA
jgi:predicted ATP-binding protein involved in virulence